LARYYAQIGGGELGFEVTQTQEGTVVTRIEDEGETLTSHVDFAAVHSDPDSGEGLYSVIVDGKSYQLYVEQEDGGYRVAIWRHRFDVKVLTEREWRLMKVAPRHSVQGGEFTIKAPMPGLVKSVLVADGDSVKSGQRLIVLEAMKMENDINAPRDGRVSKVHVEPKTVVEGGKPLVTLE
jgi:biotin carboxyl carrier protein